MVSLALTRCPTKLHSIAPGFNHSSAQDVLDGRCGRGEAGSGGTSGHRRSGIAFGWVVANTLSMRRRPEAAGGAIIMSIPSPGRCHRRPPSRHGYAVNPWLVNAESNESTRGPMKLESGPVRSQVRKMRPNRESRGPLTIPHWAPRETVGHWQYSDPGAVPRYSPRGPRGLHVGSVRPPLHPAASSSSVGTRGEALLPWPQAQTTSNARIRIHELRTRIRTANGCRVSLMPFGTTDRG
jgi:hypothetical protein